MTAGLGSVSFGSSSRRRLGDLRRSGVPGRRCTQRREDLFDGELLDQEGDDFQRAFKWQMGEIWWATNFLLLMCIYKNATSA